VAPDDRFWWRSLLGGLLAVGLGVYDLWHFGRDAGLSVAVDEALILLGISMIAGSIWGRGS
jgi:hypothetical protein